MLTPPLLRTVRIVIYGDRFEIDPAGDESSDTVLTLHPQTYILAFTGRITWREALDAGAIGVTGRQDLAADLAGSSRPVSLATLAQQLVRVGILERLAGQAGGDDATEAGAVQDVPVISG